MGRGKVRLKRIEDKISRQVTFCKRRTGLLKKAHEISLLCDVDVALIVFSATGKLSHFATNHSMERILESYERHPYLERQLTTFDQELYESYTLQHARLKSRMELLQKTERHIMGEDLVSLNVKELQNLEQQLDMALKHIRLRQNQVMFESTAALKKKDKELKIQQNDLLKKIKEGEKKAVKQPMLEQQNQDSMAMFPFITNFSNAYETRGDISRQAQPSVVLPQWIIQHMNR